MLIHHARDFASLPLADLRRPAPCRGVLLGAPDHFDVVDVRNVHMEGQAGRVDQRAAHREWSALRDACAALELGVAVLPAAPGLVDLVFTANPSLVGLDQRGHAVAVLSNMSHPGRVAEVEIHRQWLAGQGVPLLEVPAELGNFEGGGDALWHPEHSLLWAGVGPRSAAAVYPFLAERLRVPIAVLELPDPAFYHLDTCLAVLGPDAAAYVPGAFTAAGRALIEAAFPRCLEVPDQEARGRLAANLWCPDGKHVLLPAGAPVTRARLAEAGFAVVELVTDEYLKSGGSVFCMKQALPFRL